MASRTRSVRRGVAAVLAGALAAQGCGVHVQLPAAPDRAAPVQHRYSFYQQHRPAALQTRTVLHFNRYGYGGTSTYVDALTLADGTSVQRAEDLAPLVDPDSPTAQAAERSRRARSLSGGLLVGGLAASILGLGLMIPGITNLSGSSSSGRGDGDGTLFWTGLGFAAAGTILSLVAAYGPGATANEERINAFTALDASLRNRLGLCGVGEQLTDCATQSPIVPVQQQLQPMQPMPPSQPAPWSAPPSAPAPTTQPAPVITPVTL